MSSPDRSPIPKIAKAEKIALPTLAAPIETALSGRRPTMMVSTTPIDIQPSSASARGMAIRSMARVDTLASLEVWLGSSVAVPSLQNRDRQGVAV